MKDIIKFIKDRKDDLKEGIVKPSTFDDMFDYVTSHNDTTFLLLRDIVIEKLEEAKPRARGRHETHCCYRKDTARDLSECDCETRNYTKALDDLISSLQ